MGRGGEGMEAVVFKRRQLLNLDDERLVVDILSHLPTADLCRCKGVCKEWGRRLVPWALSLRPNLALAHIKKKGVWMPRFFSFSGDGGGVSLRPTPSFYAAIFETPLPKAQVLAACNGMVLACTGFPQHRPRYAARVGFPEPRRTVCELLDYALLNPVTRQISTIPPPPGMRYNSLFNFLVFDPRASAHRFMVIALEYLGRPNRPFLYSSRTGEWRPLEGEEVSRLLLSTPQFMDPWREDCYCVNGISYNIAGASSSQCVVNGTTSHAGYRVWKDIMAFDVKRECLFWVTSPAVTVEMIGRGNHTIGESAGHLSYAYLEDPTRCLSTWVLKDGCSGGEWIFRHKVDLPLLLLSRPRGVLSLFSFHPTDADLIFVSLCGPLFVANLKTLELRELGRGEDLYMGSLSPYVCPPQ